MGYAVYIATNWHRSVLYTGLSGNLMVRAQAHADCVGSGFAAAYQARYVVYVESFQLVRDAIHREKQLKRYRRQYKLNLIHQQNPEWRDLLTGRIVGIDEQAAAVQQASPKPWRGLPDPVPKADAPSDGGTSPA